MLKRAWLYVTRKNKRSILLFALLFITSFGIAIGVCVWKNVNVVVDEVQRTLGTSFVMKLPDYTQSPDAGFAVFYDTKYDFMSGVSYKGPPLDDSVIEAVMEIDGITTYNADRYTYIHVDDAELIGGLWANGEPFDPVTEPVWAEIEKMRICVTQIHSNTDTALSEKFRTGAFTLSEGRHITPEDVHKALISEELADLNQLKVGDTITLSSRLGMYGHTIDACELVAEPITVEIVGIFHINGYQPTGEWVSETDITYNWILTDMETLKEYEHEADKELFTEQLPTFLYYNITFFVDDPAQLDSIIEQVENLDTIEKGFYDITADDSMYKSTVEPLGNIRNLVVGLVAVIVLGCTIVLCIVFTMWVRSRRKEIAIYLSLGLSKASIIGQFVLEAAIIALLAGTLSFAACQEVPDMIGNQLLASAIEDAQPEEKEYTREEIHEAAMSGTMSELFQYENSEYAGPDHIDFTFNAADFFIILLLELVVIIAAICKGSYFIFELEPKQIMTDLS